jgi:hypothetical protein
MTGPGTSLPVQLMLAANYPQALPYTSRDNPDGFLLLADGDNAGRVFFGGAGVTAATGFPLVAGSAYQFTAKKIEQYGGAVWVVADTAGTKAYGDPSS